MITYNELVSARMVETEVTTVWVSLEWFWTHLAALSGSAIVLCIITPAKAQAKMQIEICASMIARMVQL